MSRPDDAGAMLGHSRETTIERDAEGRWYHDGILIERESIRKAFDRWVSVAPDGRYCLENEVNWAYVAIEGAPFFVRNVDPVGPQVELELSDDTTEVLDPESLRQGPDGALYCTLKRGLAARFDRKAMFALESILGEDDRGIYLEIGGKVRVPEVEDPLAT